MAELLLRSGDLARIHEAATTLLSPLDGDEWPTRVNRSLRELVDADMATFQMPQLGGKALHSAEVDVDHLRKYLPYLQEMESHFDAVAESRRLGVFDRPLVFGDRMKEYYESEYFHEFIEPIRAFSLLGMCAEVERDPIPPMVYLHREKPSADGFGERGRQILGLIRPHFEAGVRAFLKLHEFREDLFRVIDELPDPVLVYDGDGVCLHRSAAWYREMAGEGRTELLVETARSMATGGAINGAGRSRVGGPGRWPAPGSARREAWTAAGRYGLTATWLRDVDSSGALCLVLLETPGQTEPGLGELMSAFGLTRRQAEVALLLACRLTNREIADRLVISPHTARHHTERVLRKLGVRSRRAVRVVLEDLASGARGTRKRPASPDPEEREPDS